MTSLLPILSPADRQAKAKAEREAKDAAKFATLNDPLNRNESAPNYWVDTKIGESPVTPWDFLVLGGEMFPGACKIECANRLNVDVARQFDPVTNLPKLPTLTDKGYEPAKLTATVQVWLRSDWGYLLDLLPAIVPKKKSFVGGRDAFDIMHPATDLLGITSVIITGVKVQPPQEQTLTVVIDMLEWFPETVKANPKKLRPNSVPLTQKDVPLPPEPEANLGGVP